LKTQPRALLVSVLNYQITKLPNYQITQSSWFHMRFILRFLWHATRGHRLTPWRSPYLCWRIETYCGVKMDKIGFLEFWGFLFRERVAFWRFLKWKAQMERHARPRPRNT